MSYDLLCLVMRLQEMRVRAQPIIVSYCILYFKYVLWGEKIPSSNIHPSVCLCASRWSPEKVLTDFEMALINAFETKLPNIRTTGCYFHFCQSLWRKVQELGLAGK